jgi:aryl-alcohol dehydrogenase-like predicted oxidoreductase
MTHMVKRPLGKTGIEVSALGFGGWAIGGAETGNSLGPTDDATSRAAIDAALERGVTFFDTSDVYGHGRSERLLGEALAAAGARARVVIATKAGADFTTTPGAIAKRYDGAYLRAALGRSLERLRTDRVDLFQLHDPPEDAVRAPGTLEALARLKEEGLARAVGVSIHHLGEARAALDAGVYDVIQVPLSIANQHLAARAIPLAAARGLGVIAREPLAQGFLAGRYDATTTFAPGDVRAGWPAEVRRYLADVARAVRAHFHERRRLERPLAAIALQFAAQVPGVSTVIAGPKTPAQVEEAVAALAMEPLDAKAMAWLRE